MVSFRTAGFVASNPNPVEVKTPEGLAILEWARREIDALTQRLNQPTESRYVVLHLEPEKPRPGQVAYADGADWNPGDGAGLYVYDGTVWHLLDSDSFLESVLTTQGDLLTRDATGLVRLPLGAAGRALYSDGTNSQWATIANILGVVLTTRGHVVRRGASAVEALAAQAANTFLGGNGTDVTTRTASDVVTSIRATQANQETATSTTVAVTPGVQQYHPSAVKFWAAISVAAGVPTLEASYNVTSITDTATGQVTVTIDTDFSSANWSAQVSVTQNGAALSCYVGSQAAGSITVTCVNFTPALVDPSYWSVMGLGDQ